MNVEKRIDTVETNSFKVDKLNVRVFDTREDMGLAAADEVAARINGIVCDKGEATVVFAAAPSQNEMLESLCNADVPWSKVRALHMDEYVGLPDDAPAGFGNFLDRAIFKTIPLKEVHYLKGSSPQEIVARYTEVLKKYPPDLVLLGVGENGHLAFNDPNVADFDDPLAVKIVELDDVCRTQQVNDGCFDRLEDVPKTAITLTMSTIKKIPQTVTVVPGKKKAQAIYEALRGPVSTACPASMLKTHDDSTLYLDRDSAALVLEK